MEWKFERVAGPFGVTEGPVWDGNAVLFTDTPNGRIYRYNPAADGCRLHLSETNGAAGMHLGPRDDLFVCEMAGRRVARYRPDGTRTTVADTFDGKQLNSPDDLDFDDTGRLWFSDPKYDVVGLETGPRELSHDSVYRCDPGPNGEWMISRATIDTTRPNGVLVSKVQDRLFVAQTDYREDHAQELRSYSIGSDGTLGPYSVLHDFGPHRGIDGMCLDQAGNIVATAGWETSGPGPMVYVFESDGSIRASHPFPGSAPTNCIFGDTDLQTIYVTAHDGYLYRARTDRIGRADG